MPAQCPAPEGDKTAEDRTYVCSPSSHTTGHRSNPAFDDRGNALRQSYYKSSYLRPHFIKDVSNHMKKPFAGTVMLAVGMAVGSVVTIALHQPETARAEQAMNMPMQMDAKSAGDREMNAAMDGMSKKMASMKMSGIQDRDFMMMMTPHHQSAVDMAKIELRLGTHPELKAMARDIIKSQDQEIGQMRTWLKAWYGSKM